MLQPLEGSQALAQTVALCKPNVIAAYPITPQTHIVENIAKLVADGKLNCEFVSVESEFSAASVVLGAAAAGARTYTATASQGLLLMIEVLYNIAGSRIPVVMTCANRAVSAPLSIWNDHQDSMAARDAGWIQLYCADNQSAVDTTIQAYRIAELTELPVMVCVDGFTLTHTLEGIDIPDQAQVDKFLPPYQFSRMLDPQNPISIGTLLSPDFYPEARHSHHRALMKAAEVIEQANREWAEISGRDQGGLLIVEGDEDAEVAILTLGSVLGTLRAAMEEDQSGRKVKLINLRSFRPFPFEQLKQACHGVKELIVLERALSVGAGGIIGPEVRGALVEMAEPPRIHNVAMGLGGRDIPLDAYDRLLGICDREQAIRFEVFDVTLDKLPEEDR